MDFFYLKYKYSSQKSLYWTIKTMNYCFLTEKLSRDPVQGHVKSSGGILRWHISATVRDMAGLIERTSSMNMKVLT